MAITQSPVSSARQGAGSTRSMRYSKGTAPRAEDPRIANERGIGQENAGTKAWEEGWER